MCIIHVVIDASGSMAALAKGRIAAHVSQSLRQYADTLPQDVTLRWYRWQQSLEEMHAIPTRCEGQANLCTLYSFVSTLDVRDRVLLLTDGLFIKDEAAYEQWRTWQKAQNGPGMYAIILGVDADMFTLQQIVLSGQIFFPQDCLGAMVAILHESFLPSSLPEPPSAHELTLHAWEPPDAHQPAQEDWE